jgi:hypothetical protein
MLSVLSVLPCFRYSQVYLLNRLLVSNFTHDLTFINGLQVRDDR